MSEPLGYYSLINTNSDAVTQLDSQFSKLTKEEKQSCLIHLAVILEHNLEATSKPATKEFVRSVVLMLGAKKLTEANLLGIVRALADQTV
ncbi:MAG: hypothetical protein QNJ68_02790 [Microcoleaceae cyanobacterium MO_207.B10]|nr:hypothetical protein [Microcoleaceae cyanobacterium MO_207.B10]